MEDQYGMADLGQFISGRPLFSPVPAPQDLLSSHRGMAPSHPYEMIVFCSENTAGAGSSHVGLGSNYHGCVGGGAASSAAPAGGDFNGLDGGGDGGTGRWPRQETLTLLEIRSKLDPKFKEANQKGPLWDEVSRIMCEEHGYHRSGKKCREKFENLYKYYKKTKEGKAGRQDGKHYRFFRQLEALYNTETASHSETHFAGGGFHPNLRRIGSSSANNNQESYPDPRLSDTSLSFSHSCDSDTTSSDHVILAATDEEEWKKGRRSRGKRSWKVKMGDFVDAQMKRLVDSQEAWMEKMMRTIEDKEKERLVREEEWRKQDAARIEREHKFWASERAWIEARDAALMDTLHKMTGIKEVMIGESRKDAIWPEHEISRLIQLRSGMELKFEQSGNSEEMLWEEVATKMACFGHDRSGEMCREKWGSLNNYVMTKKRNENSNGSGYYRQQNDEFVVGGGAGGGGGGSYSENCSHELNHDQTNSRSENINDGVSESCFMRYLMGNHVYGRI